LREAGIGAVRRGGVVPVHYFAGQYVCFSYLAHLSHSQPYGPG
jgi:hypothetical protein